jgi:hypothetical protein
LGGGVDIKDNTLVAGTGSSIIGLFSGVLFNPPILPVPLPLAEGRAVVWKLKK